MEDGVITSIGQTRNRSQAYRRMVDIIESTVGSGTKIKIAYLHAAARAEAEQIRDLVEERMVIVESFLQSFHLLWAYTPGREQQVFATFHVPLEIDFSLKL